MNMHTYMMDMDMDMDTDMDMDIYTVVYILNCISSSMPKKN